MREATLRNQLFKESPRALQKVDKMSYVSTRTMRERSFSEEEDSADWNEYFAEEAPVRAWKFHKER